MTQSLSLSLNPAFINFPFHYSFLLLHSFKFRKSTKSIISIFSKKKRKNIYIFVHEKENSALVLLLNPKRSSFFGFGSSDPLRPSPLSYSLQPRVSDPWRHGLLIVARLTRWVESPGIVLQCHFVCVVCSENVMNLMVPCYFRLKTIHEFKLKGDLNFRFLLFVSFSQSRMDRCFCLLIVCCMFRLDQWKMTGFCAWKCDYVFWWMWILLYYLYLFVFEFQILRRKFTQLILWLLLIEVAWNSMPLWFIDVCAHSECLWPNGAKLFNLICKS